KQQLFGIRVLSEADEGVCVLLEYLVGLFKGLLAILLLLLLLLGLLLLLIDDGLLLLLVVAVQRVLRNEMGRGIRGLSKLDGLRTVLHRDIRGVSGLGLLLIQHILEDVAFKVGSELRKELSD
ncbi:MAG: hypothetical protein ACMG6E_02985, partial [Candidatus Roizmanbacteria bacterium]